MKTCDHFDPQGHDLNKFGRNSLDYATNIISRLMRPMVS